MNSNETMKFDFGEDKSKEVKEIMGVAYEALQLKGYNPISQIVGYILSGDPTYITSYNNARSLMGRLDRDVILEELIKNYLK